MIRHVVSRDHLDVQCSTVMCGDAHGQPHGQLMNGKRAELSASGIDKQISVSLGLLRRGPNRGRSRAVVAVTVGKTVNCETPARALWMDTSPDFMFNHLPFTTHNVLFPLPTRPSTFPTHSPHAHPPPVLTQAPILKDET